MTTNRPTRPCFSAQSLSRGCGVIARVSTQFGITRRRSGGAPFASSRSRIVSPIATIRSARRRYAPTRPRSTPITAGLRSRSSSVAISGKTSWLMTSTGAPTRLPTRTPRSPMIGGSVMQRTRSGAGPRERVPERRTEVREVVHGPPPELRALVRRRRDARDADAVVLDLPRLVLVTVEDPRDDLDLVVLRERLAELGQEVRRRLDAGPVVLVEDENALPGHAKQASRDRRQPPAPPRGSPRRSARTPSRARARASARPACGGAPDRRQLAKRLRGASDVAGCDESAVLAVAEEVVGGADAVREDERETARRRLVHDDRPGLALGEEREDVRGDVELDDALPVDVADQHEPNRRARARAGQRRALRALRPRRRAGAAGRRPPRQRARARRGPSPAPAARRRARSRPPARLREPVRSSGRRAREPVGALAEPLDVDGVREDPHALRVLLRARSSSRARACP